MDDPPEIAGAMLPKADGQLRCCQGIEDALNTRHGCPDVMPRSCRNAADEHADRFIGFGVQRSKGGATLRRQLERHDARVAMRRRSSHEAEPLKTPDHAAE